MWKEIFYPSKKKVIISLIFIFMIELTVFEIGYGGIIACEPCKDIASCTPCRDLESGVILALISFLPVTIIVYFIISLASFLFKRENKTM